MKRSNQSFLCKDNVFGSSMKPARTLWLTNVEIYKAIGVRVPSQCIKDIQSIREMWRIYMDNEEDRLIVSAGFIFAWQANPPSPHKILIIQVEHNQTPIRD